jgi:DNA-binding FrmR family transcriptional regulator
MTLDKQHPDIMSDLKAIRRSLEALELDIIQDVSPESGQDEYRLEDLVSDLEDVKEQIDSLSKLVTETKMKEVFNVY